MQEPQEEQFEN